jgi:hypothetical protein
VGLAAATGALGEPAAPAGGAGRLELVAPALAAGAAALTGASVAGAVRTTFAGAHGEHGGGHGGGHAGAQAGLHGS